MKKYIYTDLFLLYIYVCVCKYVAVCVYVCVMMIFVTFQHVLLFFIIVLSLQDGSHTSVWLKI